MQMDRNFFLSRLYEEVNESRHTLRFLLPDDLKFSRHFQTNEGLCCCLFDYLPYSSGRQSDMKEKVVRNTVLDFKKGLIPGVCADLLAAAVADEQMLDLRPETVLLTIPAATAEKHEKRFRVFSRLLSENLGIINGFPILEIIADRETGTTTLRECIRLNDPDSSLKGKDVVLVDDVFTSGNSFSGVSNILFEAGVKSVTGLFLAKTIQKKE